MIRVLRQLVLLLAVFACVPAGLLWGQTASTGSLTVIAKDPSGALIPGAAVTLDNGAGVQRADKTAGDGSFTFTYLPPGNYKVTISAPGFKTSDLPSVTVTVSETQVVAQSLEVGGQQQEVTVTGTAQTVQTETSALGGIVTGTAITSLPMPTRNYTSLLGLSPESHRALLMRPRLAAVISSFTRMARMIPATRT